MRCIDEHGFGATDMFFVWQLLQEPSDGLHKPIRLSVKMALPNENPMIEAPIDRQIAVQCCACATKLLSIQNYLSVGQVWLCFDY